MGLFQGFAPKATALALAFGLLASTPTFAGGLFGGRRSGMTSSCGPQGCGSSQGSVSTPSYHHAMSAPRGTTTCGPTGCTTTYAPQGTHAATTAPATAPASGAYSSAYTGPAGVNTTAAPALVPTGQFHEPGDGWRYPTYYNASNATYYYYPVSR